MALEALDNDTQRKVKETLAFDLENLISEVERSINFYRNEHMSSDSKQVEELFNKFHVVLTGGGSQIQGLLPLFERKLSMPVSVINTFENIAVNKSVFRKKQLDGISDEDDVSEQVNPLLSVAVGAALSGFETDESAINFLKKDIKERKTINVSKYLRVASWVFFFATLILNLYFQKAEIEVSQNRLHEVEQIADQMDTYAPKLESVQNKITVAQNRCVFLKNYLQKRILWIDVLNAVAEVLPRDVWITSFQGTGVIEKDKENELLINGVTVSYDQLNDFILTLRNVTVVAEVKPESVIEEDDKFNFLLTVKIKNGVVDLTEK